MSHASDLRSNSNDPSLDEGIVGAGLTVSREVEVVRVRDHRTETIADRVAEEIPISLVFNGVPQVVMMATPADVEDLAIGFTVTEEIAAPEEIRSVRASAIDGGIQVDVGIVADRLSRLLQRQRNLTGRTGCGVCGAENIEQVIRKPNAIVSDVRLSEMELHAALRELTERQTLNRRVGSVHGAAWAKHGAGVQCVREDVGRHNALDKVIGARLREKIDPASGYLLITSRASYEMVLKAATAGVSFLIAVSAPTALAIDLAKQCGMTLVGFAREHQHVIYANAHRVVK